MTIERYFPFTNNAFRSVGSDCTLAGILVVPPS